MGKYGSAWLIIDQALYSHWVGIGLELDCHNSRARVLWSSHCILIGSELDSHWLSIGLAWCNTIVGHRLCGLHLGLAHDREPVGDRFDAGVGAPAHRVRSQEDAEEPGEAEGAEPRVVSGTHLPHHVGDPVEMAAGMGDWRALGRSTALARRMHGARWDGI